MTVPQYNTDTKYTFAFELRTRIDVNIVDIDIPKCLLGEHV